MILNLRRGRYRPVRLQRVFPGEDIQGALPIWWCCLCGSEVFVPGAFRCLRCQRVKTERSHHEYAE